MYTGLRGEGHEAPPSDRLPENITEHVGLMATVQCVRAKTGNLTVFMAVGDVNARRVRLSARQRWDGARLAARGLRPLCNASALRPHVCRKRDSAR